MYLCLKINTGKWKDTIAVQRESLWGPLRMGQPFPHPKDLIVIKTNVALSAAEDKQETRPVRRMKRNSRERAGSTEQKQAEQDSRPLPSCTRWQASNNALASTRAKIFHICFVTESTVR